MGGSCACATRKPSEVAGLTSPDRQLSRIFQDTHRDFIVVLEGLFGVGSEWLHLTLAISWCRGRIRFEIEPALLDDAEEHPITVQPISAEHGAASQVLQIAKLIQHEVPESIVLRPHRSLTKVCVPRPFGRRWET